MSSEDEDMDYKCGFDPDTPEEGNKAAFTHALPAPSSVRSKQKYDSVYDDFQKWNKLKGASEPVSQNLLMKYFLELAEKNKPTSVYAYYSMLKATLKSKDNIDITSYSKLLDFMKSNSVGYKPVKAKIFTEDEIKKFITEAPDEDWLDVKVVCIFGVNGAYKSSKLLNINVEHVKLYDDLILVTIPRTETSAKTSFTVTGMFFSIVKQYLALRPENSSSNRFFLRYYDGKCVSQHIGTNKFAKMAGRIAKYLKLPEVERYSGLSFRINSANLGATTDTRSAASVAEKRSEKQRIEHSLHYATVDMKTPSIGYTMPSASAASNTNYNQNGYMNCNTNANTNGNTNGNKAGEHICTISCGQVKCAMEENEHSGLHTFSIMKPSNYTITEITSAMFASDPTCRWIVAYTHITEPVSSCNADEAFKYITRSIPNNVRISQKYVRGNSSKHLAAYVVVYGVNCTCQKQSDVFSFSVNEIKCET